MPPGYYSPPPLPKPAPPLSTPIPAPLIIRWFGYISYVGSAAGTVKKVYQYIAQDEPHPDAFTELLDEIKKAVAGASPTGRLFAGISPENRALFEARFRDATPQIQARFLANARAAALQPKSEFVPKAN